MSRILALDLGTSTGWALHDGRQTFSGTWDFKPGQFEGAGMRPLKFRRKLDEILGRGELAQVTFEEVCGHRGRCAAQLYGGFVYTVMSWCEEKGIPYGGVHTGVLKRYATGHGDAQKADMIRRAQDYFPGQDVLDDEHDRADALWLLAMALEEEQPPPVPRELMLPKKKRKKKGEAKKPKTRRKERRR